MSKAYWQLTKVRNKERAAEARRKVKAMVKAMLVRRSSKFWGGFLNFERLLVFDGFEVTIRVIRSGPNLKGL